MLDLLELTPQQLQAWFIDQGLPGYRAGQVRRWVFDKRAVDFQQMTDLAQGVRAHLADKFQVFTSRVAQHQQSPDGTEKLLLELSDHQQIECVLLRDDKNHHTACISTQVGCAMGCVFCASGLDGLARNLTTGEILEQLLHLQRLLDPGQLDPDQLDPDQLDPDQLDPDQLDPDQLDPDQLDTAQRLSHIVVMGTGEPLANLDALLPALAVATAEDGLGISARRITISTVGLPEGIRRLAAGGPSYHLAVSLHAPDDRLREELVPATRRWPIASVLAAADEYFQQTGRRVTYEYVLLAEVNDQPEHARRLLALLKGRPALVNVIPLNPIPELPYRTPSRAATDRFVEILRQGGLNVQVRYRKGERIDAACGQLRRRATRAGLAEQDKTG